MSTTIIGFNYKTLEQKDRAVAKRHATEIKKLLKQTAENVVAIGQRLIEIRELIPRKHFVAWLQAEFEWGQTAAYNYIGAAENFSDIDCLENFQPTALYELAAKRTDPKAITDAIDAARGGAIITRRRAKEIAAKYLPTPSPASPHNNVSSAEPLTPDETDGPITPDDSWEQQEPQNARHTVSAAAHEVEHPGRKLRMAVAQFEASVHELMESLSTEELQLLSEQLIAFANELQAGTQDAEPPIETPPAKAKTNGAPKRQPSTRSNGKTTPTNRRKSPRAESNGKAKPAKQSRTRAAKVGVGA